MITIHEKTTQNFSTLGLGTLVPISCEVEEELNGAFELELEHPYDEWGKWKRIECGRIIFASTPRGKQPFRIYNIVPTMDTIKVNARHIFYDLLDNLCSNISVTGTAAQALEATVESFAYQMPFSFSTDIPIVGTLTTKRVNPVQALLGTEDTENKSFVQTYGGEVLRDGFGVSVLTNMGKDNGVSVRYGKNLVGLEVTENEADVKTRVLAYGKYGATYTQDSVYIENYIYPKIYVFEDSESSAAKLKTQVQELFDSGIDIPAVNIKVDFVQLSKTLEYKNYSHLEDVQLGDFATVINIKMGFAKKAKVISYEWDSLLERYNVVELGDFLPTLASAVSSGASAGTMASSATATASAVLALLQEHIADKNNPHNVTAAQVSGTV